MKKEEDFIVFDEDKAVHFIKDFIPSELKDKLNEDIINYVLDAVGDYYEEKGLMNEEVTTEATIDETEMLEYVVKASQKDKIPIDEDEIQLILHGEYEYGKSSGIYFEDEE